VRQKGAASGYNPNAKSYSFTVKKSKSCYKSLKSIKTWAENSDHNYHLTLHNCQHWAKDLFDWI
jgi:pyruvate formate-lyase activating enzyme-like uncharacterized protein